MWQIFKFSLSECFLLPVQYFKYRTGLGLHVAALPRSHMNGSPPLEKTIDQVIGTMPLARKAVTLR